MFLVKRISLAMGLLLLFLPIPLLASTIDLPQTAWKINESGFHDWKPAINHFPLHPTSLLVKLGGYKIFLSVIGKTPKFERKRFVRVLNSVDNFLKSIIERTTRILLFKGGIYDLENSVLGDIERKG